MFTEKVTAKGRRIKVERTAGLRFAVRVEDPRSPYAEADGWVTVSVGDRRDSDAFAESMVAADAAPRFRFAKALA